MIYVPFDPKELDPALKGEWDKLVSDASTARDKILKEYLKKRKATPAEKPKLSGDGKVYGPIKAFFDEHVFHKKCAYCELKINGFVPHAEHYRPKGSVSVKAGDQYPKIKAIYEDENCLSHLCEED